MGNGCAGIERRGQVVEWRGEAVVRFPGDCMACPGGCGATAGHRQIPVSWLDGAPRDVAGVAAGDTVILSIAAADLTRAAVLVFGMPLAALLLGGWLGRLAATALGVGTEVASGVAGLVCLLLASILVACCGDAVMGLLKLTVRRRRMDS